jgi:ParB-like chromosome segregation protein Spo0J
MPTKTKTAATKKTKTTPATPGKTLAEVFAADAPAVLHDVVHIADLIPDANNPRKHNPKNIGMISDSLRDVGAGRSIVIDENNEIVAGNGLVEAAAEAGITKVQVVEADGNTIIAVRRTNLTPDQKRRLAIFDNRTAELAEWDIDVLRDFEKDGQSLEPFEFGGEVMADIRGELPPPASIATFRDLVPVADLTPHSRNYRAHNDAQIEHLCQSIRDYGVYRSVVIARDNTILAGHGVVTAAGRMGIKTLPVLRLDLDWDDPRALKILVGDNEMSYRADIDDRALTEMLKEVMGDDDAALRGTGYDAQQLAALAFVTRPSSEIGTIDEAKHWVGMPDFDPSKETLYEVNLRCATDADRVNLLTYLHASGEHMRVQGTRTALWWPLRARQHQGQFVNKTDAASDA